MLQTAGCSNSVVTDFPVLSMDLKMLWMPEVREKPDV
jgi:hypothetical protein